MDFFKKHKFSLASVIIAMLVVISVSTKNSRQVIECVSKYGNLFACIKDPQKEIFVAQCVGNGNVRQECSCTFNALPEISSDFNKLAVAWAIKTDNEFYLELASVFGIPVAEFLDFKHHFMATRKTVYKKDVSKQLRNIRPNLFKGLLLKLRKKIFSWKLVKNAGKGTIIGAGINLAPLVASAADAKLTIDHYCDGSTKSVYSYIRKIKGITKKTISYIQEKTGL